MVTVNPVEHVPRGGSFSVASDESVNDEDPSIVTFTITSAVSTDGRGIREALVKIPTSAGGGRWRRRARAVAAGGVRGDWWGRANGGGPIPPIPLTPCDGDGEPR